MLENIHEVFDLDRISWKEQEFDQQKEFLYNSIELAIKNKNWNNYRYIIDNSLAENASNELLTKLISYEYPKTGNGKNLDIENKYHCEIHRAFYYYPNEKQNCLICELKETTVSNYKAIKINLKKEFWQGEIFKIVPKKSILDKINAYQILDKFSDEENLISLGNIWTDIDIIFAKKMIKNGLTFDLAFNSSKINDDNFIENSFSEIMGNFNEDNVICCLTNSVGNPWGNGSGGWDITYDWTFNVAVVIIAKQEIIFAKFVSED